MSPEDTGDEATALSFTGERVIPGKVDADLWNEHVSRYYLARRYCSGKTVLDVGCGVGYGINLLADVAEYAFGFDISHEAVNFAKERYAALPHFFVGSANAVPFPADSVDVVTCFEVIEHLADPNAMIDECARVLHSRGVFFVSTPNKPCYAEARIEVGPNPFHVHEFNLAEFDDALRRRFPFVVMLAQNQQEAVVFATEQCRVASTAGFIEGSPNVSEAPFFLAVCGHSEIDPTCFAYLAESGNRLAAREHHIKCLQAELVDARSQIEAARAKLDNLHSELEARTDWARSLESRTLSVAEELAREKERAEKLENSIWLRIGRFFSRRDL